ncbi:MAG: hypothetical protein JETT_1665 [Candidatus Jettenia ecosi]|uniref:Uncharacterized protein n=1 Tax=Candidatus Jettenia ecosi TaxID=2494326 RepID=A0A533QBJ2_9BACT|nr:MAG: hypothetical protein JETT_1665 [Candidatus Jettenia ecosi]
MARISFPLFLPAFSIICKGGIDATSSFYLMIFLLESPVLI